MERRKFKREGPHAVVVWFTTTQKKGLGGARLCIRCQSGYSEIPVMMEKVRIVTICLVACESFYTHGRT